MSGTAPDLDDLRRILREVAGTAQGVDLGGDIADTPFLDLGYDSLSLLETAARIQREYGVRLDDDVLAEATTPRLLLDIIASIGSRV
jgi:act minimal PKS acyl carrier protein